MDELTLRVRLRQAHHLSETVSRSALFRFSHITQDLT